MINKYFLLFIFSLLLWSCGDNMESKPMQEPSEWITAKVAVVLPLSGENNDKERYERIFHMFEDNLTKAQLNTTQGVKLEFEWYDENSLDMNQLASELSKREDIKAIVGPLKNAHVEIMANELYDKDIPMFVMSSSEDIVRRYSCGTAGVAIKKPFMWSMATTDITLSQLILAKLEMMGIEKVSVISANNKYGDTFNKWMPFYANEMKLEIVDRVQYTTTQELETLMDEICRSEAEVVVCALENANDARSVLQAVKDTPGAPKVYFTGSVLNSSFLGLGTLAEGAEGFSMYPSPDTGFHLTYQVRYGEYPLPVEAQLYDSFLLSLVSFAYNHYAGGGVTMNETLAQLSDLPLTTDQGVHADDAWGTGTPVWDYAGLRDMVLEPVKQGVLPATNLIGASGNLKFAAESYTTLVNSTYINWLIYDGRPVTMDYIDNYLFAWQWGTMFDDLEDNSQTAYKFSLAKGYKAVLICGSEGWYNYRHQADILYIYQNLKKNGFTDDDIILIMRDDIANHTKNPNKGVISVSPQGENLYQDIQLDYRADTLGVKDIEDILLGNQNSRLATVLQSTNTDNVLLYWTGHGSKGAFSWLETKEKFKAEQLEKTVRKMYENKQYQSMLICAEPCYSGGVVKAVEGVPLVLGITAADEHESSFADHFNPELGVWMCDRFSYNLIRMLENDKNMNFYDLYKKLNASTLGSHVQMYNSNMFYNLKTASLREYFNYNDYTN